MKNNKIFKTVEISVEKLQEFLNNVGVCMSFTMKDGQPVIEDGEYGREWNLSAKNLTGIDSVRVTDETDYNPNLCNNGGKYSFWTDYKRSQDDPTMFEVSYGTSADMDYCPCCGNFINGKECCDVEDDDSYKHICETEVAKIVKLVNETNDPKIYVEINRKPCPNPDEVWYTEKWLYQDIIYALEDADVPATEENIFLVESRVKKGFDDKSDRNEMIADIVDELF